eukprot:7256581-Ditylum_brightwellii.AAC.1
MIATAIKNNLTSESWRCLMLKKEEFTWTKLDGIEVFNRHTFIWVILTTLKPTRNVDVQSKICAIESAKLSGYGNDPLKMLDGMEHKFNQIKDISGKSVFTTKQFTIQMHYVNNKNEFDAVDPKDTVIIALTTKLNSLEGKLKNQG